MGRWFLSIMEKNGKNEKSKQWYQNNLERERQKRRERYHKNRERYDALVKQYYQRIKDQVFRFYSAGTMSCRCCGIDGLPFLSLDHINGGGSEHRKMGLRGYKLYLWIVKNNFPEGFQILCHNCNQAKFSEGECPHETQRRLKIEQIKKLV